MNLLIALLLSITPFPMQDKPSKVADIHPIHISNTEINYNSQDKNVEITCRIFTDDFETALVKMFKQKADFAAKDADVQLKERVKKYLDTNLSIMIDNKKADLSLLGFEIDHEAVNVYLEHSKVTPPKSFTIQNSILYDVYDDQMSIIHIIVAGKRNTKKLNYPEKKEHFEF